ncbi:MAG: hypothetical protein ACTHKC_01765 [Candidatus Nitrosocosmicus sp.]
MTDIKKTKQSRNKKIDNHSISKDKKFYIEFKGSTSQYKEIKFYFDNLPSNLVISGLRFSFNRNKATIGGYLNPGRKSIVKKETYLMTRKQAKIRIKNWKVMIKRYREKGYSYPTISRIKKQIITIISNSSSSKKLKN